MGLQRQMEARQSEPRLARLSVMDIPLNRPAPWGQGAAVLVTGLALGLVAVAVRAAEPALTVVNVPEELTFTASRPPEPTALEPTLEAEFTRPDGSRCTVPGFWAGGTTWKVRYASAAPGTHHWRTIFSNQEEKGVHAVEGTVEVVSYGGDNPLFRHGPIRVASDRRHFCYADGTPFFWLGDTWWMGLTKRLEWPADVQALAENRRSKGFNVIQIVAGLYPDMPAFDERGANEAGFPWDPEYTRLRPEYFNAADRRIEYLARQGFVPCIVGAWGYHVRWLGVEKMKRHWREIIARWGAWPVVWCAAGETTMPYYLSTTKAADAETQRREWTEIIQYIRATDPFGRLVTCHPSQTARDSVRDPSVLDFDMQQTGHGSPAAQHAALGRRGWQAQPVMPVISGESRYEALEINPTLTDREAREAFWAHLVSSGCAGHTYGANGIWQVNRRGAPYGKSPGGNNWGTTPWDDAMRLPGSTQLALAKRFLESLPWEKFEPFFDGAVWADVPAEPPPFVCGTGDQLRLVYTLTTRSFLVQGLRPQTTYRVTRFEPTTGGRVGEAPLKSDAAGKLRVETPAVQRDQVWLIEAE